MIDALVTILTAVVIATVIAIVLFFAASPMIAIGIVVLSKIDNMSTPQRWHEYWVDWELRHREE